MNKSVRSASADSLVGLCADVALFYGFRPVKEIERAVPATLRPGGSYSFDTLAQLNTVLETGRPVGGASSLLAFYASPTATSLPENLLRKDAAEFGLSIFGAQDSMGEVILIKTICAISADWGATVSRVRINALGDRESQQRFAREFSLFLKKNALTLLTEPNAVPTVETYRQLQRLQPELLAQAPRPVNYLSEKSRTHFCNVLEQLETLGAPYQLDHTLVGDTRGGRVLFSVDLDDSHETMLGASGGRYDDYLRRAPADKETCGVHAGIFFNRKGLSRSSYRFNDTPPAKVCLVQLGTRAKLHALGVVDMLRAARIPTLQSYEANHLSDQLSAARDAGVSHVLIMGAREVLDNTVIVRSADQRTQTTVALAQLPRFLKTLRI